MQVVCKERGLGMGLQGYKNQLEITPTKLLAPQFEHGPVPEGELVLMFLS